MLIIIVIVWFLLRVTAVAVLYWRRFTSNRHRGRGSYGKKVERFKIRHATPKVGETRSSNTAENRGRSDESSAVAFGGYHDLDRGHHLLFRRTEATLHTVQRS